MANTIADKLALAADNKSAIKEAIEAKNPTVSPTDKMSQWPAAIASIPSGGEEPTGVDKYWKKPDDWPDLDKILKDNQYDNRCDIAFLFHCSLSGHTFTKGVASIYAYATNTSDGVVEGYISSGTINLTTDENGYAWLIIYGPKHKADGTEAQRVSQNCFSPAGNLNLANEFPLASFVTVLWITSSFDDTSARVNNFLEVSNQLGLQCLNCHVWSPSSGASTTSLFIRSPSLVYAAEPRWDSVGSTTPPNYTSCLFACVSNIDEWTFYPWANATGSGITFTTSAFGFQGSPSTGMMSEGKISTIEAPVNVLGQRLKIYISKNSASTGGFVGCTLLKRIGEGVDFSGTTNASNLFYRCTSLEEIVPILDLRKSTSNSNLFHDCVSLKKAPKILTTRSFSLQYSVNMEKDSVAGFDESGNVVSGMIYDLPSTTVSSSSVTLPTRMKGTVFTESEATAMAACLTAKGWSLVWP